MDKRMAAQFMGHQTRASTITGPNRPAEWGPFHPFPVRPPFQWTTSCPPVASAPCPHRAPINSNGRRSPRRHRRDSRETSRRRSSSSGARLHQTARSAATEAVSR
ncbi:hypothetical protein TNCT_389841 [Trichonephila clavata]|uniref:Uncharacterized protein n=1 Tax=Trichonephila clavata TaxID=2740835 RepID=A0A8X6JED9_TRICU|nr:hypothetical protein TNCT_389841 [Trichonephila clavata]